MRIGLLVEGRSDDVALRILVARMLEAVRPRVGIDAKKMDGYGDIFNAEKVFRVVDSMLLRQPDIVTVVALADRDCAPERTRRVESVTRDLGKLGLRVVPQYCLAIETLESWLFIDFVTVTALLKIDRGDLPDPRHCNPSDALHRNLKRQGRAYNKVNGGRKLAEHINIDVVADGNESFRDFRDLVVSAVFGA